MADISIALGPSATVEIRDDACTEDPYEGAGWVARGLRYAWLDLRGVGCDSLTIHVGGGGLSTDEEIVAAPEPLLLAVERMRDAARDRLEDRAFRQKLIDSPDCERCGRPCIDHEDQAGACPGESGWYKAPEADTPEPGPDGDEYTRVVRYGAVTADPGDHFVRESVA